MRERSIGLVSDKVKPEYQEYVLLVNDDILKSRVNAITLDESISSLGEVLTEKALYAFAAAAKSAFLAAAESKADGTEEGSRMAFNMTRVMGAMCLEIMSLKKSVSFLEDQGKE